MVMGRSQTPSGTRDDGEVGSPMRAERSPDREGDHTPKTNLMSSGSKRKLGSSPARTMHHDFKAAKKKSPMIKQIRSFKDPEKLTICLNIYDLVWDKNKTKSNAGLADLGLGFYHTGLELWGKELSFGHSKRFTSGVFAVKPKKADELMPHTVFRESITMDTIYISRYRYSRLLLHLLAVPLAAIANRDAQSGCLHSCLRGEFFSSSAGSAIAACSLLLTSRHSLEMHEEKVPRERAGAIAGQDSGEYSHHVAGAKITNPRFCRSVDKILNRLSAKYTSDAYNVVRNNCNHFTEELCQALCGKDIPEWVNRPAKMGTSTLDVLNAPFEAFNNVIKVFTPSKVSCDIFNRSESILHHQARQQPGLRDICPCCHFPRGRSPFAVFLLGRHTSHLFNLHILVASHSFSSFCYCPTPLTNSQDRPLNQSPPSVPRRRQTRRTAPRPSHRPTARRRDLRLGGFVHLWRVRRRSSSSQ